MVDLKEIVYRKLLLSKQFYKHGVEHSRKNTVVDRCLSIHHFHISVEIVLNSIIDYYQVKTNTNPRFLKFHEKIQCINNHYTDRKVPHENKIRGLNDQRNNVQHDATAPDIETVKEYMTSTELFLKEAFKLFFEQDFDNISEISLIEDARLRSWVEMARNCIEDGNYEDSSRYISIAYLLSANSIGKDINFSLNRREVCEGRFDTDRHGVSIDGPHGPIYREVSRDYEKALFISELGIIKADYDKFVSIIPSSFLTIDGRVRTWGRTGSQPTRDESLWALEFLVQIILKWQNQGLKPRIEQDTIS